MTENMFCPVRRHTLLHRAAPPPRASRCSNPACLTTFDADQTHTADDVGPWPDPAEVAELVAKGRRGSIYDQELGGSWYFQRGTAAYVE